MHLVDKNKDVIIKLCEKYRVKELYLFGSILTDSFNEFSDIDMLVLFDTIELSDYFDNYMDFKDELEKTLNRTVDIVEDQAIKNPIFRKIVDRDKKLIYEIGRAHV